MEFLKKPGNLQTNISDLTKKVSKINIKTGKMKKVSGVLFKIAISVIAAIFKVISLAASQI